MFRLTSFPRRLHHHIAALPDDHKVLRVGVTLARGVFYGALISRRMDRTNLCQLHGMRLTVPPTVFHPTWFHSTPVLVALAMGLPFGADAPILELCTGTGAAAIAMARRGARVTAVDIHPLAVACARSNAHHNGVGDRVGVHQGDLFEPVAGRRFRWIVANPPFLDGVPKNPLQAAFLGGEAGALVTRLLREAGRYLMKDGRLLLSYSSVAPAGRIEVLAARFGWEIRAIHRRDILSEVVLHYELSMLGAGSTQMAQD